MALFDMFNMNINWTLVLSLGIIGIVILLLYLKINIRICEPNEILIFSGRKRKVKGEVVGYRIIRGGIGLRTPILEKVSRLSLATISIHIVIEDALSSGMIPIDLAAIAHVKIASREGNGLENAVERLLGKSPVEIETIAKSTVEGILRGVLATFTPEEANYRRIDFEKKVFEIAREELKNLGFILDSVKIEELNDTQGYLEAVGRQRNAMVQKDARIKEAEADSEAKIVEATAKKNAADVEFQSQRSIEEFEYDFRNRKAELKQSTHKKEAAAEYARRLEELRQQNAFEEIKTDVNMKKYHAEVVIPAEANRKASEAKAIGEASYLKEQGYAMADAVKKMKAEWDKGDSKELFMLHVLPNIVESVSKVIGDNLKVDKLVVMGSGGIPSHVGDVTSSVITFLEQIRSATGIDLTNIVGEKKSLPIKKQLD